MLDNGTGTVMPVMPMNGAYGNGFGNGFGGDGWWVLLFLLAMNGGWGNGFGGGMGWEMPYFYNAQTQNDVNRGFDNANLSGQISALQGSIDALGTRGQLSDIQNAVTSGFASAEVANCNRAFNQMQSAYQNQINTLGQFSTLSAALQKCCCDNELATANLNATVAREAAENRFQAANNTKDIITNATGNTQAILDKLCQLELDGVRSQLDAERRENVSLQNQLNMATMQASQNAQTAALVQDNNAQTAALIQRIAPYPIPSYQVGNPYGYYYNQSCGCGCGTVA